jgi:hypothetical protein
MGMFDDFIDRVGDSIVSEIESWGSGPICRSIDSVANVVVLPVAQAVVENPGKTLAIVGVGVMTGGLAYVAAPAIAATIGTIGALGSTGGGTLICSLSGAALSNASLAALGGGAIAAGGGGMAAGTAVVGMAGVCTGVGVSGAAVAATS